MNIGDKVEFKLSSYEMTSCWDTPFGLVYLYTFKDFFNHVFIWKTSRLIDYDITKVKGRIKDKMVYESFDGPVDELVLSYCKVS